MAKVRKGPTIHDLRAACSTGLAGLGCPEPIIAELLAHVPKTITGRVYIRCPYGKAMAPWVKRWTNACAGLGYELGCSEKSA